MLMATAASVARRPALVRPVIWLDVQLSKRGRGHVLDYPNQEDSTVSNKVSDLLIQAASRGFDVIDIGTESVEVCAQIVISDSTRNLKE